MAREGNGYPSLCFSERENVLRCQSIFVDKPHFTNDELTFLGLGHINEFLSGIYLFVYGFARFLLSFSGIRMFSSALFFRTFLWARFSVFA